MVIVEFCKFGNLSTYLRGKRSEFVPYKVCHFLQEPWSGKQRKSQSATWVSLVEILCMLPGLSQHPLLSSGGCMLLIFYF